VLLYLILKVSLGVVSVKSHCRWWWSLVYVGGLLCGSLIRSRCGEEECFNSQKRIEDVQTDERFFDVNVTHKKNCYFYSSIIFIIIHFFKIP
jgi:hypothetical protein